MRFESLSELFTKFELFKKVFCTNTNMNPKINSAAENIKKKKVIDTKFKSS